MATQPFALIYDPDALDHLQAVDRKYYSLIRETAEQQLTFEPDRETKNRKRLRQPAAFSAEWEIRFGPQNQFRLFYRVDQENREIRILAIGMKRGNQLFVGGEEVKP